MIQVVLYSSSSGKAQGKEFPDTKGGQQRALKFAVKLAKDRGIPMSKVTVHYFGEDIFEIEIDGRSTN